MSPIRPPYPPESLGQQARDQEMYRRVDGRLAAGNASPRGFALGTTISHNAQAGNLDGVYATLSFPTSTAATQTASITHELGRHPLGFELVKANAPIHIYSITASTLLERRTNCHLGAMVYGSAVSATVRLF